MSDTEYARRQAAQDQSRNPQAPMATEQQIPSADIRNAYNAELTRKREEEQNRS